MKKLPKISIVTPSFNQGQFIERTIQSVLDQEYSNLEYIIIDGGSTDNSVEIIKKYNKYLSYWISEPDNGQTHALNKGIIKATGEIFSFLNSDDMYMPDVLKIVGEFFNENPDKSVLCGGFREIDVNDKFIREKTKLPEITWEDIVLSRTYQPQAATFWRTSVFDKVGIFREDLHYYFDQEFFIRLLKDYKLVSIDKIFSVARIHNSAKTQLNSLDLTFEKHNVTMEYLPKINQKILEKIFVYRSNKLNYYQQKILKESSTRFKNIGICIKEPILFTSLNFIKNFLLGTKN